MDLNGDGALDIIHYQSGSPTVFFGKGPRTGLLAKSTSALGEVTRITWGLSTETNAKYNNQRPDGAEGLPAALPVVKKIQRQDGSGNTYAYDFFYEGGLYTGRQFHGFRQTTQVLPSGLKVISQYEQSEGLAGMAVTEQSIDTAGKVRQERNVHYQKTPVVNGVSQVYLAWSDDQAFDPEGHRHTRTTYQMNDRLVCTSVTQDPNPDIAGDEVIMKYGWARNDARGIWGLLSKAQIVDTAGNVLREAITYYDGLPENQAVKDLPTRAVEMVQPGTYIARSFEYDRYGNIVKTIDRENNAATFAYDETNTFRVRAVDAEGRIFTSAYDPRFGSLKAETDAAGRVTLSNYDAFGRLVKIAYPGDNASPSGSQTITYSPLGDPGGQYYQVSKREVSGQAGTLDTTYYFDGMGRIYRAEREADGGRKVVVLTRYDFAGNANEISSPFFKGDPQVWTVVERDELNQPFTVTQPDGSQISTYQAGWRADITDARGVKTSYYRNSSRQVTEVHQWNDGVEQVTRYQYDLLGNLTKITDALGEETRISYDALGRKQRLVDPNAGTYDYKYDNEGRVTEVHGSGGSIITYRYDRTGLILAKEFSDGSSQHFTYNPAGELVQVNDAAGTLSIGYDKRGRPASHQRVVLGNSYEIRYAFDALDRITGITYPDGYEIHYAYGSGGNLLEATDGRGAALATGMAYNASGQLQNIVYGNGVQSSLAYDEMQRMTFIQTSTDEQEPIQSLEYSYDPNGNILSIVDNSYGYSQNFTYDDLGRLVEASGKYGLRHMPTMRSAIYCARAT